MVFDEIVDVESTVLAPTFWESGLTDVATDLDDVKSSEQFLVRIKSFVGTLTGYDVNFSGLEISFILFWALI